MRGLFILSFWVSVSAAAVAEGPRWCSVSSIDPSNTIHYAPIAAAAQVEGGVSAVIIYRPNGRVEKVDSVSGTLLLSQPLANQLSKWTVRSNAPGDADCQTQVFAVFTLRATHRGKEKIKLKMEPNTLSISISKPRPIVYEDSAIAAKAGF